MLGSIQNLVISSGSDKKEETNMNSIKDAVAVETDATHVILGASEEHRLDHRLFLCFRGARGKARVVGGATRGDCSVLYARARGSVHCQRERCGCPHQSLQGSARGILDVAAGEIPGGPGARERCDRESREGVRPALRGALEQLRRAGSRRHRTSRGAAFFRAKS